MDSAFTQNVTPFFARLPWVGAILGFVGATYFDLFKGQTEYIVSLAAGGGALLFGLMHLLHYDH